MKCMVKREIMHLSLWLEKQGHGAVARLVRKAKVSRNTVEKAQRGEPISVKQASAISKVTKGNVSAVELAGLEAGA